MLIRVSRRKKHFEVWDASHTQLVGLWQIAGHLFPHQFVARAKLLKTSPDVIAAAHDYGLEPAIFFSATLACGHVVRVPIEIAGRLKQPKQCRTFVPCYKCWAQAGGRVAGLICSFCGVPHPFSEPCMRPHPG